jgi:hypothetical protein
MMDLAKEQRGAVTIGLEKCVNANTLGLNRVNAGTLSSFSFNSNASRITAIQNQKQYFNISQ